MADWDNDSWGIYEAECQACDEIGNVNDQMLCQSCAEKLERDMIRQREWAYSAAAYGLSAERREELYRATIKKYGKEYELIAPPEKLGNKHRKKK